MDSVVPQIQSRQEQLAARDRQNADSSVIGSKTLFIYDLRHSYAVASIRSSDGPKELQAALGHHSPSFSLSVYGYVTDQMQQASANRMESYIKGILGE